MRIEEIIINLRNCLQIPVGRHLYGVLGTYNLLKRFESELMNAKIVGDEPFPKPISVNRELIEAFSDDDFRSIVEDEAKRPEPTRASIRIVFEKLVGDRLERDGTLVLKDLELIFVYNVDFGIFRVLATDNHRVILLLPGKRSFGRIVMYPDSEYDFRIPQNLVAENHLWEVTQ